MFLKFIIPLYHYYFIYSLNNSIVIALYYNNMNYMLINLMNIKKIYILKKTFILLIKVNIYKFLNLIKIIRFNQSLNYLPTIKLHFRFKGAWLFTRSNWPRRTSYKFGFGHPLRYNISGLIIRLFRRYIHYSGYVVNCVDWKLLDNFIYYSSSAREFNVYNRRGMKYSRERLILKVGSHIKAVN